LISDRKVTVKLGRAVIEQYRENAGHNDSAILVRHDKTVYQCCCSSHNDCWVLCAKTISATSWNGFLV